MEETYKQRLAAALAPLAMRVRRDICWIKSPGHAPRPIDQPLDDGRLLKHVNGGPAYGAAPIAPGTSVTLVGVLDFDSHKGQTGWGGMVDAARKVADVARLVDLEPIAFRSSGGKGIHLYFLWDTPQDARSVRAALTEVLEACGFRNGAKGVQAGQVEVFPKQDSVEAGRFGNMFVLPLAGASVPLLGLEMEVGTKDDAVGMRWPASLPVPVVAPPERREPAAGEVPADLAVLAAALDAIPNSGENQADYDMWLKVVLAVHEETGGSEEGRELARRWSARADVHDDDRFDLKAWDWASMQGPRERRVTGAFVYGQAAKWGWQDPRIADDFQDLTALDEQRKREQAQAGDGGGEGVDTTVRRLSLKEMVESLVLIREGARVATRAAPHLALPLSDIRIDLAASTDIVVGQRSSREVLRVDTWLKSPHRVTVHTQTFAPGESEFCRSPDGTAAQNLWLPRERRENQHPAPEDWAERARPFFDHLAYLVPDDAERERLTQWLAHIEQVPGVLPHTHYLMVARQTGIGRNWLAYVLGRVWQGYTALGFRLADTLRSGFNGQLSRRVLAVVDELHEGGHGWESQRAAENLKMMLTEETRAINPKYGRQHVEFNCCRFLMFSNHDAALPLAENDRRIIVLENPTERRSREYYSALYGLLQDRPFIASVTRALQAIDLRQFNPGEPASTSVAKRAVIRAGRSDVAQAMVDVAASWGSACISAADLKEEISELTGISVDKLGRLAGSANEAGLRAYPATVRIDGQVSRVWILRAVDVWHRASWADVTAEVLRGRAVRAPSADNDDIA